MTNPRLAFRTVFISDVHLGSAACQADYLLDFLRSVDCQTLFLVGDIVDLLAMRRRVHWPAKHAAIIDAVIAKARRGTRVVYIPGNHDAELRRLAGSEVAGVEIRRDEIHALADGRRFLVAHGDEFDGNLRFSAWLHAVGDVGHQLLLQLNRRVNGLRRRLGLSYWPIAVAVKSRLASSRRYVRAFELAVTREARRRGFDGFIGGHLHVAGIRRRGRIVYCNDGDWVEHCTALVEDHTGRLSLLQWTDRQRLFSGDAVEPAREPELQPAAA